MNLVDPSGGIGWRNRERAPFVERVRPDVVLALALVHHLAIAANVPLPEVVAWLAASGAGSSSSSSTPTTCRSKRLLANKPAGPVRRLPPRRLRGAAGRAASSSTRQQTLPGGTRTLYLAEPKP